MSSRINIPNSPVSRESRSSPPQRLFSRRESGPVTVSNFFQIYFTFAYYLCITPFRIVFSEDTRWFQLRTSNFQKGFCIFFHILSSLFIYIDWHSESNGLQAKPIPTKYFFGATDIIHYIFKIYCIKVFFLDGQRFVNILNFAASERSVFSNKLHIENSYLLILLNGIHILFGLARASEQIIPRKGPKRIWPWTDEKYIQNIRSFYFADVSIKNDTNSNSNSFPTATGLDYILVIISSLSCTTSAIVGYFMDLLVFFSVLTLWSPSYSLSSQIKPISVNFEMNYYKDEQVDEEKEKHEEAIENHMKYPITPTKGVNNQVEIISNYFLEKSMSVENQQLEKLEKSFHSFKCVYILSELINHATGHMITFYMARAIFFNSACMDDAFVRSVSNERILWKRISVFYTLTNVAISVLAADAHGRMKTYKLSFFDADHMDKVPCDRLQAIIGELNVLKVGIKGSKMFTVTFGLLWNVLSTVITYFIICLQDT